jgi:hypothetical protein
MSKTRNLTKLCTERPPEYTPHSTRYGNNLRVNGVGGW